MASTAPGGNVLITWRAPSSGSAPSGYKVLAGLAPGVYIYEFPVTGTSLGGAGVPPATYYARIVAVNGAGVSAPTTELTIVVR
jgi:hypothetical protein